MSVIGKRCGTVGGMSTAQQSCTRCSDGLGGDLAEVRKLLVQLRTGLGDVAVRLDLTGGQLKLELDTVAGGDVGDVGVLGHRLAGVRVDEEELLLYADARSAHDLRGCPRTGSAKLRPALLCAAHLF